MITASTISSISVFAGCLAGAPSWPHAVSQSAAELRSEWQKITRFTSKSRSIGHGFAISRVESLLVECSQKDWDGEGAAAISIESAKHAMAILDSIPATLTPSTVTCDRDGWISFEWFRNPRWVLAISFSPNGFLHFASLRGEETRYGRVPGSAMIPNELLDIASEILGC